MFLHYNKKIILNILHFFFLLAKIVYFNCRNKRIHMIYYKRKSTGVGLIQGGASACRLNI